MIENFLRPPRGSLAVSADILRILGLLSVIAAAIWWTATDAGILALVLPGLLVPRFVGVHPGFDVVYCVVLLVAGWSNVLDLYTSLAGWDVVMHFFGGGVAAALIYLILARTGFVPAQGDPKLTLGPLTTVVLALGLAGSALWEMVEWLGYNLIDDEIFVAYSDTIGDMAVGGVGSLVATLAIRFLPLSGDQGAAPMSTRSGTTRAESPEGNATPAASARSDPPSEAP